jgi:hypothetical protein
MHEQSFLWPSSGAGDPHGLHHWCDCGVARTLLQGLNKYNMHMMHIKPHADHAMSHAIHMAQAMLNAHAEVDHALDAMQPCP